MIAGVYTPEEIEGIRAACHVGRLALDAVGRAIAPGVTTDELDRVCHEVRRSSGSSGCHGCEGYGGRSPWRLWRPQPAGA